MLKGHFVGRLYSVNVSLHVIYDGRPQQSLFMVILIVNVSIALQQSEDWKVARQHIMRMKCQ